MSISIYGKIPLSYSPYYFYFHYPYLSNKKILLAIKETASCQKTVLNPSYSLYTLKFFWYSICGKCDLILFASSPNMLKYFHQILRIRSKNKEYVTQKEFQIQEMPDHVTMTVFSEIFKDARHYTLA